MNPKLLLLNAASLIFLAIGISICNLNIYHQNKRITELEGRVAKLESKVYYEELN